MRCSRRCIHEVGGPHALNRSIAKGPRSVVDQSVDPGDADPVRRSDVRSSTNSTLHGLDRLGMLWPAGQLAEQSCRLFQVLIERG